MLAVDVITDRAGWRDVLRQMPTYDYCHSYDFHWISARNGEGLPVLFALRDAAGRSVFCWPALQRPVAGTQWCDITSVYGYGGPLSTDRVPPEQCLPLVLERMRELGAISLFSRMHPMFIEQLPDDPALRGELLGDVVVIDVLPGQDTLESYRKDHRRGIRRAIKAGVTTRVDTDGARIGDFLDIYTEAMRSLGAADYYSFDREYFQHLSRAEDFKTVMTFAELDGKTIAAGLSLITNRIMQSFLGGSLPQYRDLAPMKLITEAEHRYAQDAGVRSLILGGGLGLADDDLLMFKKGFSDHLLPFYAYKKVLRPDAYSALCARLGMVADDSGYFPAYRTPDVAPVAGNA